ncbi:MAG: gamma-glutamyl-gamma-aminobutyrate hydrolase family protein [Gemmatimonadota bacterium]
MSARPVIGVPTQTLQVIDGVPGHLPDSWVMSQRYFLAVSSLGGIPWMIPLLDRDPATLREIYDRLDGLFLPGGVDLHPESYGHDLEVLTGKTDPARDSVELDLTRWAVADGKPVLGACRGMQTLNVAVGGTLFQDVHEERAEAIKHDYYPTQGYARDHLAHPVELEEGSRLRSIYGLDAATVNSMHHQGVRDAGPGVVVSARAPDGLVEGIELPDGAFGVGVQWHPEMLLERDAGTRCLFESFLDAARAFQRGRLVTRQGTVSQVRWTPNGSRKPVEEPRRSSRGDEWRREEKET